MKPSEYVDMHTDEMLEVLKGLIEIPSVFDSDSVEEGKPFGKNVSKALHFMSRKAFELGMSVAKFDGYAGEFTAGEETKIIGVLAHIDVVSAEKGWNTNPFQAEVRNGKIYGRGALDDKGPAVAVLYAVKYLMEEDLIPKGTGIRIILGTDEEEDWRCIEHYLSKAKNLPLYSIVPDANFPLINCEKGLIDADFSYQCKKDEDTSYEIQVEKLSGGTAKNVVPCKAEFVLQCSSTEIVTKVKNILDTFGQVSAKIEEKKISACVNGKSTHAMSPEKGLNAISLMMQILGQLENNFCMNALTSSYNQYIGMDYYGEHFGCDFEDELSGKLTFNVGTIDYDGEFIKLGVSIRYPATMRMEKVVEKLSECSERNQMTLHIHSKMESLYIDAHAEFIQKLMGAYQKVTDDKYSVPLAIGGATYARAIPNAVAFGPLFPDEEELAHEANECISIENFKRITLIYIEALKSLLHMIS